MKKPKITFVAPVYNSAPWISNTIRSLLRQTYKNFEIIIVNDGSTDGIEDIMEYFCNKDKRIKYIHGDGKRHGAAVRRNQGNRLSQADIICVTDAGDEYHNNKARATIDWFKKNPETDLLHHSVENIDIHGKRQYVQMAIKNINPLERPRGISHPTVAYTKRVALKYPYIEGCLHTDQYEAIYFRLKKDNCNIEHIPNILLKKIDLSFSSGFRNIKEASIQKIKMYKEYGIKIESWLQKRVVE